MTALSCRFRGESESGQGRDLSILSVDSDEQIVVTLDGLVDSKAAELDYDGYHLNWHKQSCAA